MALGKAIGFVRQALIDNELREVCCQMESKEAIMKVLDFNADELEDAFNMKLVKCQTEDEAEVVLQLKEWFKLI